MYGACRSVRLVSNSVTLFLCVFLRAFNASFSVSLRRATIATSKE